jgi:hypothetical protein
MSDLAQALKVAQRRFQEVMAGGPLPPRESPPARKPQPQQEKPAHPKVKPKSQPPTPTPAAPTLTLPLSQSARFIAECLEIHPNHSQCTPLELAQYGWFLSSHDLARVWDLWHREPAPWFQSTIRKDLVGAGMRPLKTTLEGRGFRTDGLAGCRLGPRAIDLMFAAADIEEVRLPTDKLTLPPPPVPLSHTRRRGGHRQVCTPEAYNYHARSLLSKGIYPSMSAIHGLAGGSMRTIGRLHREWVESLPCDAREYFRGLTVVMRAGGSPRTSENILKSMYAKILQHEAELGAGGEDKASENKPLLRSLRDLPPRKL